MDRDSIAVIEIDGEGRLHVIPATQDFPYAYREAMEVSWDSSRRSLHSPVPRVWSYGRWLEQITALALAQGVRLELGASTKWVSIPAGVRAELSRVLGQDA